MKKVDELNIRLQGTGYQLRVNRSSVSAYSESGPFLWRSRSLTAAVRRLKRKVGDGVLDTDDKPKDLYSMRFT